MLDVGRRIARFLLVIVLLLGLGLSTSPPVSASGPTLVSGLINANTTWTLVNSPYIVTGGTLVSEGATLTIEPGVVVKFNSGFALQVNGQLLAQGTESSPITFTSNQAEPAPGDWGYILFSDTSVDATYDVDGNYLSGSILQHCVVEYGGGATGFSGTIEIRSSLPFINRCWIKNNSKSGIYAESGAPRISFNTIESNGNGIFLVDSYSTVNDNTIRDNLTFTSDRGSFYSSGSVVINNNVISDNSGSGIGCAGMISSTGLLDVGSGIFVEGGNVTILNNVITSNQMTPHFSEGGGINCYSSNVTIRYNLISNNSTGGIDREGGATSVTGNIVIDNNGTGIRVSSATLDQVTISGNVVANNVASGDGGGIYVDRWNQPSPVAISRNTIIANSTGGKGAAVYVSGYLSQTVGDITNNLIIGNYSSLGIPTSAIFVDNFDVTLNGNNIYNKTADELYNNNPYGTPTLDATNNWWGTTVEAEIQAKIHDWFDLPSLGIVDYSPYLTELDANAPPSPPTNLVVTLGVSTIDLSWNPNPESDITGYKVYYDTDSGFPYDGTGANEGDSPIDVGNITSFSLSGSGSAFYLAVAAYDSEGNESWYSQEVTAGGSISGHVYEENGSTSIEGAVVMVWDYEQQGPLERPQAGETTTDGSGHYSVIRLPVGEYRVVAWAPNHAIESYQETFVWGQAQPVSVAEGQDFPGIDFTLGPGGTISGSIIDATTGLPLSQVSVFAGFADDTPGAFVTASDESGNYLIKGLPYGTYVLQSPAPLRLGAGDDNYVTQYWQEKMGSHEADVITVSEGVNPTLIDFALEPGGFISGTVTDADTTLGIADCHLYAVDYHTDEWTGGTETDLDGNYTLMLPPGDYRVGACASCSDLPYADRFYNNVYGSDQASPVTVTEGQTTSPIDFTLEPAGFISGSVTDADTTLGIADLHLYAQDYDTGDWIAGTETDLDGNYTLTLPPGDYRVGACASCSGLPYVDEYYADTCYWEQATPVTVTVSETTPIDFTLEPAGSISGRVTDTTGNPIPNMTVDANWPDGYGRWGTCTDEDGYYTLDGLPYGEYKINAKPGWCGGDPGYLMEYWQEKADWESANILTLSAQNPDADTIDFTLELVTGSISGTITYTGEVTGTHNLYVSASIGGGPGEPTTVIEFTGPGAYPYTISAVPDGSYYVYAILDANDSGEGPPESCEPFAYYPDLVTVSGGGPVSGIDIDMIAQTGSISGEVSYQGAVTGTHDILIAALVTAGQGSPSLIVGFTSISGPGPYTLPCLPDGEFSIYSRMDANDDGQPSSDEPMGMLYEPVTISGGSELTGIDFTLYDVVGTGSISGTVSYSGAVSSAHDIYVMAWSIWPQGMTPYTATVPSPGDAYTISDLTDAAYLVLAFLDADDNASPSAGDPIGYYSDPVTVSGGGPVTGIDFSIDDTPKGWVMGGAELEGRSDHSGAQATLIASDYTEYTATSLPDGSFYVLAPVDTYTLFISMEGYLNAIKENVAVDEWAEVMLDTITLSGGDADHNQVVNISDLVRVAGSFGTSPADEWADLNADGRVDLYDLVLAGRNLGKQGPAKPEAEGVWTAQDSGTTMDLHAVDFFDASQGWAVGKEAWVLRTSDGGANWICVESDGMVATSPSGGIWIGNNYALEVLDPQNLWMAGSYGRLFYTGDGGENWAQQYFLGRDLLDMTFIDGQTGWVVGDAGFICHTADGVNWSSQASYISGPLYGVDFTDSANGWAVGSGGSIFHTTDGGSSWPNQPSGVTVDLHDVDFIDALNGWAVGGLGGTGTIIHTTDGGANWVVQEDALVNGLWGVAFPDALNGWAVGGNGAIYHTIDGGNTWTMQPSGITEVFRDVFFTDIHHGWAVGTNGTILKYTGTVHIP